AGFLNTLGAVRLAAYFAAPRIAPVPVQTMWSRHIIWGNHLLSGGVVLPDANAWRTDVVWGAMQSDTGDNIVWGSAKAADNIVWGTVANDNIVSGGLAP